MSAWLFELVDTTEPCPQAFDSEEWIAELSSQIDHRPAESSSFIHPTAIIGDPPEHREWVANPKAYHQPIIGLDARIHSYVTVDGGLEAPTRIGARCFLMTKSHVGHDAVLGDECELAPGAVVGGHATLGNKVRVGLNACIKPHIAIGDGARIGMGSVVIRDVPAGEIWAGNPARRIG